MRQGKPKPYWKGKTMRTVDLSSTVHRLRLANVIRETIQRDAQILRILSHYDVSPLRFAMDAATNILRK